MYGTKERNQEYILRLLDFIRTEYGIHAKHVTPAKRGYYGETWHINDYFIKLDYSYHKDVYRSSFPVMEYICCKGMDRINTPVKTLQGELTTDFDGAVMGIFNWLEGENLQNDETRMAEYRILAKVYALPTDGIRFQIHYQSFLPKPADLFFEQWSVLDNASLRHVLDMYKEPLKHRRRRLEMFAQKCAACNDNFYITHGDAGGNIIKNGDTFYLIDWDGVRLAPPERDAWFYMHQEGELQKFQKALHENGIDYCFRPERLAFSCYYAYFQYLNEYMRTYFELGVSGLRAESLQKDFFEGWIEPIMKVADKIPL